MRFCKVRGGIEVRFHEGSTRVLSGFLAHFHQTTRPGGLWARRAPQGLRAHKTRTAQPDRGRSKLTAPFSWNPRATQCETLVEPYLRLDGCKAASKTKPAARCDWWLGLVVCSPGPGRAPIAPGARRLHLCAVKAASQAKAAARCDWWLGFVACLKLFTVKSFASLQPQEQKHLAAVFLSTRCPENRGLCPDRLRGLGRL